MDQLLGSRSTALCKRRFEAETAQKEGIQDHDAQLDKAEVTLEKLPFHETAVIPEAKYLRYLTNATHKDGGPKAKMMKSFGHQVQPGGFDPPIPASVRKNHKDWERQTRQGLASQPAVMQDKGAKTHERFGVSFNVDMPFRGLDGRLTGAQKTAWSIKRSESEKDKDGKPLLEMRSSLSTSIPLPPASESKEPKDKTK